MVVVVCPETPSYPEAQEQLAIKRLLLLSLVRQGSGNTYRCMEKRLEALQKLLATTDGRDKVYRLVQFAAKLTRSPYTAQLAEDAELVPLVARKAFTLELILADSRKLFRLARGLNILVKYWSRLRDAQSGPRRPLSSIPLLQILADVSLFWFFAFDHIVWLYRSRLWTDLSTGKRVLFWTRCAGHCLFFASLASLFLHGCRALREWRPRLRLLGQPKKSLRASRHRTSPSQSEHAHGDGVYPQGLLLSQHAALSHAMRYSCDVLIGLNMARPGEYSQTLVGAAGVLSSVIQIVQLWPQGNVQPESERRPVFENETAAAQRSRRPRRRVESKHTHQS